VFIDGRADIYERTGVLTDYINIARLALPAPFLLNAYNVQSCLLERQDILVTLLNASPGWQKIYGDPITVLYVRRPRASGFVIGENDAGAKASEPLDRWADGVKVLARDPSGFAHARTE
jgi:hypothetical protein